MMATKKDEGYLLDGSGNRVLSGSGEAVRTGSYDDPKVTENRMEAAREQLAQDVQNKLMADKAKAPRASVDIDESDRRKEAAENAPRRMPARPGQGAAKPKSSIVTKEQLAKEGLSLRDYMNKQKNLTRRDGKAPSAKSSSGSSAVMNDESRKRQPVTKSPSANYSNEGRSAAKQAVENYSNEGRGRPAPVTKKPELGPMAAGRYSPGYARQLDQTEQKRIGRLEGERIRDAENNAKRQAERDQFNSAMRNDPKQQEIRAAREKAEGMTPGQRSAERGKAVKEFFGYAKGGTVSAASKRADGIAQRGKTRCKVY